MRIVVLPRQMGKTTALIKWLESSPENETRIGVFITRRESMRMLRKYGRSEPSNLQSWQFISFEDLPYRGFRMPGTRLVYGIDNVDVLIQELVHGEVGFVTLTDEDSLGERSERA